MSSKDYRSVPQRVLQPLREVPSAVLDSPSVGNGPRRDNSLRKEITGRSRMSLEVVPDSEEERRRMNVIEISSDEDDSHDAITSQLKSSPAIPGSWPETPKPQARTVTVSRTTLRDQNGSEEEEWVFRDRKRTTPGRSFRARRIVESSDSDQDSAKEVLSQVAPEMVELSDSSSERPAFTQPGTRPVKSTPELLYVNSDGSGSNDDDGAILILDEPKSARKPIRRKTSLDVVRAPVELPRKRDTANKEPVVFSVADRTPADLTLYGLTHETTLTPSTSHSSSPTKPSQPRRRRGKKAIAEADLLRRQKYAQELFTELNKTVFACGLPHDTKLSWSKRLLTTAGRAKWHKSRDGVQASEIELAEKILDCDVIAERIRNTLSHEMCHLASWVIDKNPKENHGKLWRQWAARVMVKRPEIEITTKHNYEISHPFEWKCQKCNKIYGRFSKSIRPDECVCGVCKEGRLIPLFTENKRATTTPKTSRNATTKPQDSPHSIPRSGAGVASRPSVADSPSLKTLDDADESESDIEILTTTMMAVAIAASETRK